MPITQSILEVASQHPERVAIAGEDGRLSYAELVEDSRRVFAVVDALHRAHDAPPAPAPETRGIPITAVSIESAFHTSRIVAGLAGYRAVSATIDPRWPLEHRVNVVLATGIGLVISDADDLAPALRERGWGGTIISLPEFRAAERDVRDPGRGATPLADAPTVRDGDEPFLLLFSSGTTSAPKGFLKTRDQYRANVAVSSAYLEPLPGVHTLAPGPVSYSLTLYALIECLATGGAAHMADAFDAIAMARRVHEERITRVVAVPALVQSLSDAARRDPERFASLELVVTGGANLSASLREGLGAVLPGVRLISYYGAAEIGFIGDSRGGDGTLIEVYEGIGFEIRSEAGERVPDSEFGTLWIDAAACSDGYLAGTTDAVLRGADGWATVHDQGRIVDGRLQLAGRAGDIVVTGGHKVALPEVERAFEGMPGLGAVCAVALPHPRLGSVVGLVVEGVAEGGAGKDALRAWGRERLAPQFVPRQWYRLDALPRTVGGKIRRAETVALIEAGEGERL
ncbi:acyl-CoA synthetase (AMP-forming)/AMP-acid ligase II [Leucobacter komagatae]|uniref:Acyl-CoA synthetase (AMP-forming)/AMP-acid ligase II n=1 Tax=Leucobacter komagatae TaxID=55969 RepID=A0A542Y9H3_9MICO|nr:long-chain fatty acid--CoA ligase [Leucobacter komagatae]TQL44707.1 acyl-CoA synthetase (AMP-forming)/AMP-acid ligase II [Leucobacter komagatae]